MLESFKSGKFLEEFFVNCSMFHSKYSSFFFRWTQFLIIISSHSDPTTGDLYIGLDNVTTIPVIDVSLFLRELLDE
jgi:hypothetical protein